MIFLSCLMAFVSSIGFAGNETGTGSGWDQWELIKDDSYLGGGVALERKGDSGNVLVFSLDFLGKPHGDSKDNFMSGGFNESTLFATTGQVSVDENGEVVEGYLRFVPYSYFGVTLETTGMFVKGKGVVRIDWAPIEMNFNPDLGLDLDLSVQVFDMRGTVAFENNVVMDYSAGLGGVRYTKSNVDADGDGEKDKNFNFYMGDIKLLLGYFAANLFGTGTDLKLGLGGSAKGAPIVFVTDDYEPVGTSDQFMFASLDTGKGWQLTFKKGTRAAHFPYDKLSDNGEYYYTEFEDREEDYTRLGVRWSF